MHTHASRRRGSIFLPQVLLFLFGACAACALAADDAAFYVYDLKKAPANADDYDEVSALVSMQGLVNRDGPRLYVDNPHYGRPAYWLDILSAPGRWLEGRPTTHLDDLDAVFQLAQPKLKGAVIWDPEVPATVNVATTIAGVEDAVVFSPAMADRYLRKWDLPVIKDLRGMFSGAETGSKKNDAYRWAIREYVESGKCSPHLLCLYTDSFYDRQPGQIGYVIVRDWAVQNRAFTYDLSPWGDELPGDDPGQPQGTDLATYKFLLAATRKQSAGQQMTEVSGFFNFQKYANMPGHPSSHDPVPTEWETVYLISPYNCYQNTVTHLCYNQSFHCHAPVKPLKQSRPHVRHALENKSYIAILMADYDSTYPLYDFLPKHWDDPVRGELPLAWGINPNLMETYPDLISYFYETATPRDNFVADASAAGYMNPNRVEPESLPLFVEHNRRFYELTDMTISGMVLDWDQPRDDVKDAFVKFSPDGYATIVMDLHGGSGKPPQPHVWKGMPIVNLLGADPNSPQYTANEIYRAVQTRRRDEPGFYDFRCVWVSPSQVKASIELFAEQHPDEPFELVDIYTFFDLFKQHRHRLENVTKLLIQMPEALAVLEGGRVDVECMLRNMTSEPTTAALSVAGMPDVAFSQATVDLEPDRETRVGISGSPTAEQVVVDARGPFGLRQSSMEVRIVPAGEILGDVPKHRSLQFISDLAAGQLPHTTGRHVKNADGTSCWQGQKGETPPGYLVYGPYAELRAGRYLVLFRLKRTGEGAGDVVQVDACGKDGAVRAAWMLRDGELPVGEYRSVALTFEHPEPGGVYESRVLWTGQASLELERVTLWKILD